MVRATGSSLPGSERSASTEDARLLEAMREGDEGAFLEFVTRHHWSLVRLATAYVRSRSVAEEVAQETWLAVLNGLDRFEGRSTLKTWVFTILINRAKTRAQRERRVRSFSSLAATEVEATEYAVDPDRFCGVGAELPGHWASPPKSWGEDPEALFVVEETQERVRAAIEALPRAQRIVITLRDVNGCTSEEVCNVLEISETNQRVLLHRARSKVRAAIERYLDGR